MFEWLLRHQLLLQWWRRRQLLHAEAQQSLGLMLIFVGWAWMLHGRYAINSFTLILIQTWWKYSKSKISLLNPIHLFNLAHPNTSHFYLACLYFKVIVLWSESHLVTIAKMSSFRDFLKSLTSFLKKKWLILAWNFVLERSSTLHETKSCRDSKPCWNLKMAMACRLPFQCSCINEIKSRFYEMLYVNEMCLMDQLK